MWWRALFLGCLAIIVLAEDNESELSKRQTSRGNTVIFGAAPSQYLIQSADRSGQQQQQTQQVPADYQPQPELYVISPNRKASGNGLAYLSESSRRPQYIQLSSLHLQQARQPIAYQQPQHQQQQQSSEQVTYENLLNQPGTAGHGSFYRPATRVQPEQIAPVQYAASGIVDSQAGSFERELAQLVAANRAQEQRYNIAPVPLKRPPAPQQYLKEITRPTPRPKIAAAAGPIQYQPVPAAVPQAAPLYRFVYQHNPIQQIPQTIGGQQQYKQQQQQEQPLVRPQLQQYLQTQDLRVRGGGDDDGINPAPKATQIQQQDAATPSRSTIYVSHTTPLKKPNYVSLAQLSAQTEREEDENVKQPVVRLPIQRNRPLTQDEFQQILQSGGYTATLIPSDNPNSPHQEYLLHPNAAQRPVYTNEKQEPVTYLLPQQQQTQPQPVQQQRQIKRRPIYQLQQA